VAWVPTHEGAKSKVTLPLGAARNSRLTAVRLSHGLREAGPEKLTINSDGSVSLMLSGTPTIIRET